MGDRSRDEYMADMARRQAALGAIAGLADRIAGDARAASRNLAGTGDIEAAKGPAEPMLACIDELRRYAEGL